MNNLEWQTLESNLDASVNFVGTFKSGKIESRYVRREPEYFIAYLSSHSGCKHACRFCHLTASGQTSFDPVSLDEYVEQAKIVLEYYQSVKNAQGKARRVHFNWMSRGEALSNPTLVTQAKELLKQLEGLAESYELEPVFNVSTIMPKDFEQFELTKVFEGLPVVVYYSLYSLDSNWRRKWIPRAMNPFKAIEQLSRWQKQSDQPVVLHWSFIHEQNDSKQTVKEICEQIKVSGLNARFNLVRYNPYSDKSTESDEEILNENFNFIKHSLGDSKSRIVPRVGFDVKASCGMFV